MFLWPDNGMIRAVMILRKTMRENKMNQIRKKVKKGFTLMELLMVIAISGILAALAVVGVFHFNQTLKIMELNNTAEEIFIAAQNHLTALQANSAAATLFDQEKGDKSQWGTPVSAENAPADIIKAKGDTKGIYAFDNSGKGNNGGAALQEMILPYGAIDSTVADGGSWIIEYYPETYTVCCVFYTDGKSTVLGSKSTRTISTADTFELNKLANGEETRISKLPENGDGTTVAVGYYSGLNGEKLSQTDISGDISLELHNEEILYGTLKFNDVQVTRGKESGNSDASTNAPDLRLVISVEGRTSGEKAAFSGTISSTGNVSLQGSSKKDIVLKTGKFSYSGGKATGEINFVLDDITASGYHFAELFPGFIPGEKISVSASLSAETDARTATLSDLLESNTEDVNSIFGSLSAHSENGVKTETASIENFRHLENLSPEVSHVAGMTKADSVAEKVLSLTTSGSTYKDGKFRLAAELSRSLIHGKKHDYSWDGFLSKTEEIKNGSSKSEDGTGSSSSSGSSAEKTADKAADKTTDKTSDTTTDKTADKTSDTTTDTTTDKTTDTITGKASDQTAGSKSSSVKIYYCGPSKSSAAGSYVPVNNNYLTEFDGNKKTIEGVMISSEDQNHEARGLFGTFAPAYDAEIKNLYIRNFDITSSAANDSKTGTLCGNVTSGKGIKVSITGISVYEKDKNPYCGIWTSGSVKAAKSGGLIGEIIPENDNLEITISECSASVYVQGSPKGGKNFEDKSIAGGLIGNVAAEKGKVTIEHSYTGGHTGDAKTSPFYTSAEKERGTEAAGYNVNAGGAAGGLVGAVNITDAAVNITDCYSTSSVACISNNNVVSYSDAGGLIGYISQNFIDHLIKVENCYATGLVSGKNTNDENVSAIVGYIASKSGSPLTEQEVAQIKGAFTGCQALVADGMDDNIPLARMLTKHTDLKNSYEVNNVQTDLVKGSMDQKTIDELAVSGTKVKAEPYDASLKHSYPFRTVAGQEIHYGDWPDGKVTEGLYNGNRLILKVTTNSDYVTVLITGLQSGAKKYLILNNSEKTEKSPSLVVGYSLNSMVKWDNDGNPSSFDKQGNWKNQWQNLLTVKTNSKTGVKEYELMLDNISKSFGNFESIFDKFYYGEYINVRVIKHLKEDDDPVYLTKVDKQYTASSLFEQVVSTEVADSARTASGGTIYSNEMVLADIAKLSCSDSPTRGSNGQIELGKSTLQDLSNFTPVTAAGNQYTAIIANSRHLEDLDSSISGINTQNEFKVTDAVQNCDIFWRWSSNSIPKGYVSFYDPYYNELKEQNAEKSVIYVSGANKTTDGSFFPITVKAGSPLKSYDGQNHRIVGLYQDNSASDLGGNCGLFGKLLSDNDKDDKDDKDEKNDKDSFTISNLTIDNEAVVANNAITFGSFVGYNEKNLTLSHVHIVQNSGASEVNPSDTTHGDLNITVEQYGGAFVGESGDQDMKKSPKLVISDSDVTVGDKGDCDFNLKETDSGYIAGLVGCSNGETEISNTWIKAKNVSVDGKQNVGGLLNLRANSVKSSAAVSNSGIIAGSKINVTTESASDSCGGIIGYSQGNVTLKMCNLNAGEHIKLQNGKYTGGLIGGGDITACGLINCSIEAPEIKVSSNGNDGYAGGIIGKFKPLLIIKEDESKATISACHLSGKNSSSLCRLTVTSPNYCGGLAAVVDGSDDLTVENSYIDADESEVSVTGTNSNYGGGGLFGKCLVTGKVTMENCHFRGRTAVVRRSLISNNAPKGHFGGLIGDVKGTSQFIMDGCYASTYIYAPYSDSTGGLIGYLNTASTSGTVSKITNCYVSGRTNNGTYNAKYKMPEDTTNLTEQTMMNIVGQNCSGGFIGQLDSGNLEIDRSFSTASVYCYASSYNETSGGVGGFLGCRNQNTSVLNITRCYSTGLVQQQYSKQPAAGFIGKLSGSDNMTLEDCHTLKGINPGMKPLYQTKNSGVTKVEAADLSHVSDQVVNTHTYDELLKGNYPYIFTKTDSIESSDGIDYDGDWPTVFGEDVDKRVSATEITFNLNNPKVVVGGSTEITAMINPPDADASTVTWKTDSANIEISGTGNTVTIQGKSAGDASVTASIEEDNITATCNIQVVEPHIDINNTSMSIVTGASAQLTATTYIMKDDKTVTWTSSDNEIALVDNNGTVTGGSKVGRATVTAISNADNNLKASCSVYVCPNSTVFIMSDDQVVQENAGLDVDKSQQAPYTCIFKHNNDNAWLAISVDNNNIANAWLNGNTLVIEGVNTGSTTITITGNYYDSSLGGNAAVSRTITVLVS
jgi:prepilin-type N-terminal cleavage/methylation domain-containing protein